MLGQIHGINHAVERSRTHRRCMIHHAHQFRPESLQNNRRIAPHIPKPQHAEAHPLHINRGLRQQFLQPYTIPCPVAFSRPSLPPQAMLLPVTTLRGPWLPTPPCVFRYVSIIQSMIWLLVPTSGAGMSCSGPMASPNAAVNRRVSRINSLFDNSRAFIFTPPFAPAIGQPHQRRLHHHPGRQCLAIIQRHFWMKPNPSKAPARCCAESDTP